MILFNINFVSIFVIGNAIRIFALFINVVLIYKYISNTLLVLKPYLRYMLFINIFINSVTNTLSG